MSRTAAQSTANPDANKSLTTLVAKHYNDLLGSQTSERGRDEVTFFYVGDLFCTYLGTMYADFQDKILQRFLEKSSDFFSFFQEIFAEIFS